MAQQEGGWPLGLQPLNVRVGLIRKLDFSGSLSFNTLTSGSATCSSVTSADLDSQSTGSFFHERSITLGSLIGITSNILELSSRSLRSRRRRCGATKEKKKSCKAGRACFSLCPRAQLGSSSDAAGNAPSLGHFLEVERRACNAQRNQGSIAYEIKGLPECRSGSQTPNSLFSNGLIAPPRVHNSDTDTNGGTDHDNGYWFPLIYPCMR